MTQNGSNGVESKTPIDTTNSLVLEREYELAKERLESQRETINALGDNATKMLRVVLLLVAGIITGVLSFGDLSTFTTRFGLTFVSITFLFVGAFFLVSGSLGVGSLIEEIYEIEESNVAVPAEERKHSHLGFRLEMADSKIKRNNDIIDANRRIMEFADGAISLALGFGTFFLIDLLFSSVWVTLGVSYFLFVLMLGSLWMLDDEFPAEHQAKVFKEDRPWIQVVIALGFLIILSIGIEEAIEWLEFFQNQ